MGKPTNSGLWEDYTDLKYRYAPNYSGLEGHSWTPPISAPTGGLFKPASPSTHEMKKPAPRIIADNLPPRTYSASAVDIPKRENVIQIDLPTSSSKVTQFSIDPRTQIEPNVEGNVYHGLNPELPTTHGTFLETSNRTHKSRKSRQVNHDKKKISHNHKMKQLKKETHRMKETLGDDIHDEVNEAIQNSIRVEKYSDKLMKSIEGSAANKLSIKMVMTNKQETPALKLKYKK